ncbi:hypothetical protein KCP77_02465 [Salmonella enterica subsp. enterica]|nr:hypothetical protein KCP77_02465 [Salmonella enterica subsp. enterica]
MPGVLYAMPANAETFFYRAAHHVPSCWVTFERRLFYHNLYGVVVSLPALHLRGATQEQNQRRSSKGCATMPLP